MNFITDYLPFWSLCSITLITWAGGSWILYRKWGKPYLEYIPIFIFMLFAKHSEIAFNLDINKQPYALGLSLALLLMLFFSRFKQNELISVWNNKPAYLFYGLLFGVGMGLLSLINEKIEPGILGEINRTHWISSMLWTIQVSFTEELAFRWLLINYLKKFELADVIIVLIQGVIFGAAHLGRYHTPLPIIYVTLFGVLAGWMVIRQKNIAGSSIAHIVTNLASFLPRLFS